MKKNIQEIISGYLLSLLLLIVVVLIVSFKQHSAGEISNVRVGFLTIIVLSSMAITIMYTILLLPMIIISYFIRNLKHSRVILNLCFIFLMAIYIYLMHFDMGSDLLIAVIPIASHLLRIILIAFRPRPLDTPI